MEAYLVFVLDALQMSETTKLNGCLNYADADAWIIHDSIWYADALIQSSLTINEWSGNMWDYDLFHL